MGRVQRPMTITEFVQRAVGIPWVRWRSDWGGADCFGILVLYFREVLGVELGPVPMVDMPEGFAAATGWEECPPEPGSTGWMAWHQGAPAHCGVLLPGAMLLHSDGTPGRPGAARLTRLAVMQRHYSDLRFYRRAPC